MQKHRGKKMYPICTEPKKTLWIHWLQGLLNTVGIQIAFNYKNHFRKIQLCTNGIFYGNMCMHIGFIGLTFEKTHFPHIENIFQRYSLVSLM